MLCSQLHISFILRLKCANCPSYVHSPQTPVISAISFWALFFFVMCLYTFYMTEEDETMVIGFSSISRQILKGNKMQVGTKIVSRDLKKCCITHTIGSVWGIIQAYCLDSLLLYYIVPNLLRIDKISVQMRLYRPGNKALRITSRCFILVIYLLITAMHAEQIQIKPVSIIQSQCKTALLNLSFNSVEIVLFSTENRPRKRALPQS